jgi:hypothetical protein
MPPRGSSLFDRVRSLQTGGRGCLEDESCSWGSGPSQSALENFRNLRASPINPRGLLSLPTGSMRRPGLPIPQGRRTPRYVIAALFPGRRLYDVKNAPSSSEMPRTKRGPR